MKLGYDELNASYSYVVANAENETVNGKNNI